MIDWSKYDPGDAWKCSCDNLVRNHKSVTLSQYTDRFEVVLTCPFCEAVSTHVREFHESDVATLEMWRAKCGN